jgi:hypothetical protein
MKKRSGRVLDKTSASRQKIDDWTARLDTLSTNNPLQLVDQQQTTMSRAPPIVWHREEVRQFRARLSEPVTSSTTVDWGFDSVVGTVTVAE